MNRFAGAIPGVLAEMLVFGSVLPAADRVRVERQLMTKHGIELPSLERDRERALEQQANAMLMERAPGRRQRTPCPLRYLARHNEMSWSQVHPVTGERIRPKRIGVRETAESSDWGEGGFFRILHDTVGFDSDIGTQHPWPTAQQRRASLTKRARPRPSPEEQLRHALALEARRMGGSVA